MKLGILSVAGFFVNLGFFNQFFSPAPSCTTCCGFPVDFRFVADLSCNLLQAYKKRTANRSEWSLGVN